MGAQGESRDHGQCEERDPCDGDCVIGGVPCDGIQGESGDRDHAMGVQGECGGLWDGEDLDPHDGGQGQGGFPCDGGVCVMCVQGEGGGSGSGST